TNGWYILKEGSLRDALFAPYAQLLILKLILFAVMLGLASLNRFRLTPALRDALKRREEGSAIENLRRSIILELTAGVVILFLVA
ncbi:CopD family protein, partial [Acinetobacter baumannii]